MDKVVFEFNDYERICKITEMNKGKRAILTKLEIMYVEDAYSSDYLITELDYVNKKVLRSDRYSNADIENYGWDTVKKWVEDDMSRLKKYGIDWYSLGIIASATILIPFRTFTYEDGKEKKTWNFKMQGITSGGVWGIESDSEDKYILNEEVRQIEELKEYLRILNVDMSLLEE